MKKLGFVAKSLALFAVITWCVAPVARADDAQTISRLEHKIATTSDPDEAMKYYESGDDVVIFDFMGPPREFAGHKAIHDHLAEFSGYTGGKVDFLELKVISDGKLALARSVQHYTAKAPDGSVFNVTLRLTDLWRKTHGEWKLVDQHVSVPVDMKSGKADLQSKM